MEDNKMLLITERANYIRKKPSLFIDIINIVSKEFEIIFSTDFVNLSLQCNYEYLQGFEWFNSPDEVIHETLNL